MLATITSLLFISSAINSIFCELFSLVNFLCFSLRIPFVGDDIISFTNTQRVEHLLAVDSIDQKVFFLIFGLIAFQIFVILFLPKSLPSLVISQWSQKHGILLFLLLSLALISFLDVLSDKNLLRSLGSIRLICEHDILLIALISLFVSTSSQRQFDFVVGFGTISLIAFSKTFVATQRSFLPDLLLLVLISSYYRDLLVVYLGRWRFRYLYFVLPFFGLISTTFFFLASAARYTDNNILFAIERFDLSLLVNQISFRLSLLDPYLSMFNDPLIYQQFTFSRLFDSIIAHLSPGLDNLNFLSGIYFSKIIPSLYGANPFYDSTSEWMSFFIQVFALSDQLFLSLIAFFIIVIAVLLSLATSLNGWFVLRL